MYSLGLVRIKGQLFGQEHNSLFSEERQIGTRLVNSLKLGTQDQKDCENNCSDDSNRDQCGQESRGRRRRVLVTAWVVTTSHDSGVFDRKRLTNAIDRVGWMIKGWERSEGLRQWEYL